MKQERYVSVERVNEVFKGKTITSVEGLKEGSSYIYFNFDGEQIEMFHSQSCCESVEVEDICGKMNLDGAIFYELQEKSCDLDGKGNESFTWTFYTLVTSKGYTDIRWYGSSNGYYSESVDLSITYKEEE